MRTITVPQTGFETLDVGYRLTVAVPAGGNAIVTRSRGGQLLETVQVAAGQTRKFGEYELPMHFQIDCTAGSVNVSVAQTTDQVPARAIQETGAAVQGAIGEYKESAVAVGSAVALTTGVAANVTSLTLEPGDWDVSGVVLYHGGAGTVPNDVLQGISQTSATVPGAGDYSYDAVGIAVGAEDWAYRTPTVRVFVQATTTVYLVSRSDFSVSTLAVYGRIRARRITPSPSI